MTKIISAGVLVLIFFAIYYKRDRKRHLSLILSAFVIDVALVLYIELTRHAIDTATHPMHPFVLVHVLISVTTVLLYLFQIILGIGIIKGKNLRHFHIMAGAAFILFRLANFGTSLFVEKFVK